MRLKTEGLDQLTQVKYLMAGEKLDIDPHALGAFSNFISDSPDFQRLVYATEYGVAITMVVGIPYYLFKVGIDVLRSGRGFYEVLDELAGKKFSQRMQSNNQLFRHLTELQKDRYSSQDWVLTEQALDAFHPSGLIGKRGPVQRLSEAYARRFILHA